ncbi:MAG: hypothetical protein LBU15_02170 [Rickettsiales bacterium]|nr:hypothetical protein [Rickettsiales bacterium]
MRQVKNLSNRSLATGMMVPKSPAPGGRGFWSFSGAEITLTFFMGEEADLRQSEVVIGHIHLSN